MGKDRLYFLTFISILLVFLLNALIGLNYSVKINVNLLLETEYESSQKEAQKIANMLKQRFVNASDNTSVLNDFQQVLYAVESGISYTAILDKENNIVCHPNLTELTGDFMFYKKLGKSVNQGIKIGMIHSILMDYEKLIYEDGVTNFFEIFYEKPIIGTNFKVVSVLNLDKLLLQVTKLKRRLYSIFVLMGALIIIVSFFTVRFIGSCYEKNLESKNIDLENDIINIAKLNLGVFTNQQRIITQKNIPEKNITESHLDSTGHKKIRMLTYKGDEIIPVCTNDISYIHTENTVTYIFDKEGGKTVCKASLDEIYGNLDATLFFRANRQFIIHIVTIEKIIKYGNNQFKIIIKNSDVSILIKKNKVAEFKRWLNI